MGLVPYVTGPRELPGPLPPLGDTGERAVCEPGSRLSPSLPAPCPWTSQHPEVGEIRSVLPRLW